MSGFSSQISERRASGIAGRILGTLFFMVFLGMGAFFVVVMLKQLYRNTQTYNWSAVPCVILESGVTDKGGNSPYEVRVQYQYDWEGQSRSSAQLATEPRAYSDYGKAQRLADKFRADTKAVCFVNPTNPSEAILERTPLWGAFFLLIPLVFVGVGAFALFVIWRRRPVPTAPAAPKPILTGAKAVHGRKFAAAFFTVFLVVGLAAFYFVFVRPAVQMIQARHWQAVPCTIISSRVQTHSGDDGNTYSIDILYRYEIDGREYRANRYHFVGFSSSGYKSKRRIVDLHPPGATKTCYVNPADPNEAVMHRGFSPVLFFGLIPLVFVAVGLGGLFGAFGKKKSSATVFTQRPPGGPPRVLKPRSSPVAKFIGGLFITVFWNGIVSVFIWLDIQMWLGRESGPKWFLTIFLIPFVLVGLGIIYMTIHAFFGLFSPRVQLRVDHDVVALGGFIEINWEFSGRVEKLRDLHLSLEGRTEQDEGSGKNRRTHTDRFYTAEIIRVANWNDLRSGSALCTIPTDKPVSDSEGDRRVIWCIRLKAKVEFGADLEDEYPITVILPVSVPTG